MMTDVKRLIDSDTMDRTTGIGAMHAQKHIALRRLLKSPFNMRIKPASHIEALADNIAAQGLLQNLVVHPMPVGPKKVQTYGVAGGESRRLALLRLVERKLIKADFEVPCLEISIDRALLASTSENEMRENAHPADQCMAFKLLVDSGFSAAHVAAVYGTTTHTVTRRLKLANLSPKLLDLFREDKVALEQVQALALSDSHEMQESVWFNAASAWYRRPEELRRQLTLDEIAIEDSALATFVGIDAFEAAGGIVRRDLFSEEDAGYFSDIMLMETLAIEKLELQAVSLRTTGWKWVECRASIDHAELSAFSKIHSSPLPPTEAKRVGIQTIRARMSEIAEAQNECDEDDARYDLLEKEWQLLSDEVGELSRGPYVFALDEMAHAGVIVCVSGGGRIKLIEGLVKPEDRAAIDHIYVASGRCALPKVDDVAGGSMKAEKGPHSEKLIRRLTAQRTAAIQIELADAPHVALATVVHRLSHKFIYDLHRGIVSALELSAHDHGPVLSRELPSLDANEKFSRLRARTHALKHITPMDPNEYFAWLLDQNDDCLLEILGLCTALSLDSIVSHEKPHAINTIRNAMAVDMSRHWQANRVNYFDHVSKAHIVSVITEQVSVEEGRRLDKMKKGEAAHAAEVLMEGRGWMPSVLASTQVPALRFTNDSGNTNESESEAGAGHFEDQETNIDLRAWTFPSSSDLHEPRQEDVAVEPVDGFTVQSAAKRPLEQSAA